MMNIYIDRQTRLFPCVTVFGNDMKPVFVLLLLLVNILYPIKGRKMFPKQVAQFRHCNNCYAVAAYDIIKYHQPKLNVTVREVMQKSRQTCTGGVPTIIFDHYFPKGSRKTSGSFLVLQRILRKHGPCVVSFGKGHLVVAVSASAKGAILIRDPADGQTKRVALEEFSRRRESLYFNYIAYPLV